MLVPTCLHVGPKIDFRIDIDVGSISASDLGPSLGPRRLNIRHNGGETFKSHALRAVLNTTLFFNMVSERFGFDFGGQGSIFGDLLMLHIPGLFWACIRLLLLGGLRPPRPHSWLVLGQIFS